MAKVEALLGGNTRFAVLEALADTKKPVTAYEIAITKGLDPAATYRCLTEFSEFRIVESETKERNQTAYILSKGAGRAAVEFLLSLKQKTPKPTDLEDWISPKMQSDRMAKIVKLGQFNKSRFKNQKIQDVDRLLSRRVSGELSALVKSSEIAFDELFEKQDNIFVLKTR